MRCRLKTKIYYNESSGYTVAAYWTEDESVPKAARGHTHGNRFVITAVGNELPLNEKTEVELAGNWVQNPKHGLQLEVESSMEVVPRTREGIIGYLSSGAIKGIGERLAETLFSYFGLDTLEVMEHTPERLLAVRGISEKKLVEIQAAFQKNKTFRELMVFLSPMDVSANKVQKILDEFGAEAPDIIRSRPYRLCQIKGFGFLTVDQIAMKCHGCLNDPIRIAGCLAHLMKQAEDRFGHLYVRQETLISEALEFLNREQPQMVVTEREVQNVLYRLVLQKSIVVENGCIYNTPNYEMEVCTAKMVVKHMTRNLPVYDVSQLIDEAQTVLGITLSASQAQAVRMTFANPISIITGGPGTGKTTVLKVILYIYQKLVGEEVQLMAPTGRAARRMMESTGETNASTMHMALGLIGDGEYTQDFELLSAEFFNVDEFSMVDMRLAYEFFLHLKADARLVLIGDVDQLPSVKAGDVFRELIQCGLLPVTVLDLAYRQAENSLIHQNAQKIKKNHGKLDYGGDFQFYECKKAEEAAQLVLDIYRRELSTGSIDEVQVLTPYRKKGAASVNELNQALREIVNPAVCGAWEMTAGGKVFREGDKVLQTKNTNEVSNGDVGKIIRFYNDKEGKSKAELLFSDNRKVQYGTEEMEDVELAYATTIHKSQGSEYPVVILPWIKGFYTMLKRPILYTAITRAKVRLILIGDKSAVYQAVHTDDSGKRNTRLGERIQKEYQLLMGGQKNSYEQLKLAI